MSTYKLFGITRPQDQLILRKSARSVVDLLIGDDSLTVLKDIISRRRAHTASQELTSTREIFQLLLYLFQLSWWYH